MRDRPQKAALARDLVAGGRPVSAIAAALGVSRPHPSSRYRTAPRRRGRPPLPDAALLAAIQTLITVLPTYGYLRVHAQQYTLNEVDVQSHVLLEHEPADNRRWAER